MPIEQDHGRHLGRGLWRWTTDFVRCWPGPGQELKRTDRFLDNRCLMVLWIWALSSIKID